MVLQSPKRRSVGAWQMIWSPYVSGENQGDQERAMLGSAWGADMRIQTCSHNFRFYYIYVPICFCTVSCVRM
jgi:hypothetical protein